MINDELNISLPEQIDLNKSISENNNYDYELKRLYCSNKELYESVNNSLNAICNENLSGEDLCLNQLKVINIKHNKINNNSINKCQRCLKCQVEIICEECNPLNSYCFKCDNIVHSLVNKKNHLRNKINSKESNFDNSIEKNACSNIKVVAPICKNDYINKADLGEMDYKNKTYSKILNSLEKNRSYNKTLSKDNNLNITNYQTEENNSVNNNINNRFICYNNSFISNNKQNKNLSICTVLNATFKTETYNINQLNKNNNKNSYFSKEYVEELKDIYNKEKEELLFKIKSIQNNLDKVKKQCTEQIQNLQNLNNNLNNQIDNLTKENTKIAKRDSEHKDKLNNLYNENTKYKSELTDKENKIEELKKNNISNDDHKNALLNVKTKYEDDIKILNNKIEELSCNLQNKKLLTKQQDADNNNKQQLEILINNLKYELDSKISNNKNLNNMINHLSQENDNLLKEISNLKSVIDNISNYNLEYKEKIDIKAIELEKEFQDKLNNICEEKEKENNKIIENYEENIIKDLLSTLNILKKDNKALKDKYNSLIKSVEIKEELLNTMEIKVQDIEADKVNSIKELKNYYHNNINNLKNDNDFLNIKNEELIKELRKKDSIVIEYKQELEEIKDIFYENFLKKFNNMEKEYSNLLKQNNFNKTKNKENELIIEKLKNENKGLINRYKYENTSRPISNRCNCNISKTNRIFNNKISKSVSKLDKISYNKLSSSKKAFKLLNNRFTNLSVEKSIYFTNNINESKNNYCYKENNINNKSLNNSCYYDYNNKSIEIDTSIDDNSKDITAKNNNIISNNIITIENYKDESKIINKLNNNSNSNNNNNIYQRNDDTIFKLKLEQNIEIEKLKDKIKKLTEENIILDEKLKSTESAGDKKTCKNTQNLISTINNNNKDNDYCKLEEELFKTNNALKEVKVLNGKLIVENEMLKSKIKIID